MYQIAAFDLDGTIADTVPMCIRAFRESVLPYTDRKLGREEILQTFGLNETGMVKAVVKKDWQPALHDFYLAYERMHDEVTEPFPGILNLLALLKQKKVTVALITGKGEKSCAVSLKKLGLSKIFDEVLCGSSVSPNKGAHMEYLLKKYAVSKENFCYIADTVQDVKICREIGVSCLSAAWQNLSERAVLEKENPGLVFECAGKLEKYICQILN